MIETITILGGRGKTGEPEPVERLDLQMGNVASIVGPTGSGKTTLINDIEMFAERDTPSGRTILINGSPAPEEYRNDPSRNPIALITQHTTFLSDLPVGEFLEIHARVRSEGGKHAESMIADTIDFANELTGEAIGLDVRMTELSGGQTRSLLIADATIICDTPIVLLDEVENAGIDRSRCLELLRRQRKIFIFVTHDPRIALLSDFRIVIAEGRIMKILGTNEQERELATRVTKLDDVLSGLREKLRLGYSLTGDELQGAFCMKLAIAAGPATTGKTSVLRHAIRKLIEHGERVAFLKIDVQYADEDELLAREFGIPTRKLYSGELCPDHCSVMVLGDAMEWADKQDCNILLVETAGLCLRCAPYVDGGLGICVLEATSGMNLPLKVGPILSLADVCVVTKGDLVSQAEREVFRARIQDVSPVVQIREANALYGIGIDPLVASILATPEAGDHMLLRGSPPVGTCTICVGKRDVGWQSHFGVVRALDNLNFYRGQ